MTRSYRVGDLVCRSSQVTALNDFKRALVEAGWTPIGDSLETAWTFRSGAWEIVFDTSRWMELYINEHRVRNSDTEVPTSDSVQATVDRIARLFEQEQLFLDSGKSEPSHWRRRFSGPPRR